MQRRVNKRNVFIAALLLAGTAALIWYLSSREASPIADTSEVATTEYLQADTDSEEATVATAAETHAKRTEYIIQDVPHYMQSENYPTGCESVAAVSLMQYYDVDISVSEFIDSYLPKADYPACGDDGILYGESPWEYFIGDPRSSSGYGCYSPAIVTAMKAALPAEGMVYSISNASLEILVKEYIAKGNPVLIWATIGMQEAWEGNSWILPDGSQFTFICPEHALLLIGYDEENYYFCDSMSDKAVTAYPKADCEAAFTALGMQAIVMGT